FSVPRGAGRPLGVAGTRLRQLLLHAKPINLGIFTTRTGTGNGVLNEPSLPILICTVVGVNSPSQVALEDLILVSRVGMATEVLPMCWISAAKTPSAVANRSRSIAKTSGHRGSYSLISI